jgi:GAF domain-containing protein
MRRRGYSGQPSKGRRQGAKPKARKVPTAHASVAVRDGLLGQRTRERDEALEQLAATSEVLKVISSSPSELKPVFDAILEHATRICEAKFGTLGLYDGEAFHNKALCNVPPEYAEARQRQPAWRPPPGSASAEVVRTKRPVLVNDLSTSPGYLEGDSIIRATVDKGDARTMLLVPMLKDDQLVGLIAIYRKEVQPFTDKQITLVQNFAAQAVIAIENTRLLNELRQRTADLSEALEQQTATSEVLQVISSAPGDLEPVFQSILANAVRICEAKFGTLYRTEGDFVRCVAMHGVPKVFAEERRRVPVIRPAPTTTLARALATRRPVQIADVRDYPDAPSGYTSGALAKLAGARTLLAVPMLTDVEIVGVIVIYRREVRPFTDKQIELVKNFAAQAVIAIENTRLLNELRHRTDDLSEALERQTATSDVLKIISSSPGDLQPVFNSILANATRICEAKFGTMWLHEGDVFRVVALHNAPPAYEQRRRNRSFHPTDLHPKSAFRRFLETKQVIHIADLRVDEGYLAGAPTTIDMVDAAGARTGLMVPMLRGNELVGGITIYRQEVRPFTDKQIDVLQNFAAQAVVAIENARLLNELRESLEQQTAASQVLHVISSSPGELEPVFQTILENATRICEAKFGVMYRFNDAFHPAAMLNAPEPLAEFIRQRGPFLPPAGTPLDHLLQTKTLTHIADVSVVGGQSAPSRLGGARSFVAVPLLKENKLIGAIIIYRQEVRPFTDKQIELVQNFAAQAVIAVENTRLLNDLNLLNQQLEQRVTDQVSEIERMSKLRRFLPPQVADLIVASGAEKQLESHRREITALFCDLRGFTGFSEKSDPEDVMSLLREYHAAIGEIIVKYSGTLEHYAGDGVMVFFNDPIPVENPALQAVQTALEMRTAIEALTEKWRRLGHELGFGVGIAHGFATLGTIGFEGRFDYAAIGTVSNVASRLCDEARSGQILISSRVLMALEDAVNVEPVGEFALKGISRPVAAYNVLSAVAARI